MENHDIDDLVNGKGVLNWEHSNKGEDIIGAVIYAHKILDKKDCENDRQRKYWDFVKKPFVYIIGELFEDEEHPGAIAVAAMIRYYAKKGEKLLTGFSIEGATLERRDYILQESVGRRVAVTLRPCNHTAIAGLYEDPKAKKIAKDIEKMSKSIDETLVEIDSVILEDEFMPKDPILDLYKAMTDLEKTLEAGMGNVAPSQLTGGAALTREHITGFQRNRLKAVVRDWDRKRPLKEVIKAALPEVSDDYLNHFEEVAEELALKKSRSNKLVRAGASHSPNPHQSDAQKKLMEGLFFDSSRKFGGPDFNPGHDDYTSQITKHKNDAGQHVMVKGGGEHKNGAKNSTHYYEIANDVFGMGKHVPVTNYFKHPTVNSSNHHQAMEIIPKAKTSLAMSDEDAAAAFIKANKDGSVHKMAMMDSILGSDADRHSGNTLLHPKGHLVNIDNDASFDYDFSQKPAYLMNEGEQVHPEAAKWVKGIDAKALAGKMMDQGHHPTTIKHAVGRLMAFQKLSDRPEMSIGHLRETVNAQVRPLFGKDLEGKDKKAV